MKTQSIHGPRARQWRRELEDSSSHRAEFAALCLGRYLLNFDEVEGLALLDRAVRAEDPGTGARAAWALAEFHRAAGARMHARDYLSYAENLSHNQFVPDVLLSLASRYAALGDVEHAIAVYERLLAEGSQADRELTATAAFRLADLFMERRAHVRAVDLLRRAIRDGSRSLRIHAMSELGDFLFSCWRGEVSAEMLPGLPADPDGLREAVETLYRRVVLSDHADLAPRAAYYLADLRRAVGDWVGAEADLRMVAESEHPIYAPLANQKLREVEQRTYFEHAVEQFLDDLLAPSQLSLGQLEIAPRERSDAGNRTPVLFVEGREPWDPFHDCAQGYTSYILIIYWVRPRKESFKAKGNDRHRSGEIRDRRLVIYHANSSCSFPTLGSLPRVIALHSPATVLPDGLVCCGRSDEVPAEISVPL